MGLELSSQAGSFAGLAVELAFLGHAGAMQGGDLLESSSGTTACRGDRQVRDKEMGAAGETAPMEGATLGRAGLSRGQKQSKAALGV